MEVGGSSRTRNRRVWSREEEEALLIILEDVVARGQHCDTGSYKSGTISIIERQLAEMCPQSNLKANPHIESKLKLWKKHYGIIYDMQNKSGFGWNDSRKCVEVDSDEAWTIYVQHNKSAEGWRNKPFPIYDRLVNIFGKDRATGTGAQTPVDMVEDENNEEPEYEPDTNWGIPNTPISPMSVNQSSHSEPNVSSQRSGKKRGKTKANDDLVKGFEQIASTLFNKLSDKFDNSESNYPKYLATELERLKFPLTEILEISKSMRSNPSNVEVFKIIKNDADRIAFAKSFLEN